MFRIGILGTENSHAMAFAKILNGLEPAFKGQFDDFRVVAVGGIDPAASKAVAENSILNKWFYIYCANSIITDQEEGWILTFLHPQTISDISD